MSLPNTTDAAGGAGSIAQSLLQISLNGLSRTIDGALSKRYPLTSMNETETLNAQGTRLPSGAPQAGTSVASQATGFFQNPVVIGVSIAISVSLVLILVLRRK